MRFTQLPRRKKQIIFAASFLALSVIAGLAQNIASRSVNADSSTDTTLDTVTTTKSIDTLFQVKDSNGQPVKAYVDAVRAKSDCTTDPNETLGFTGETLDDGTAVLSLPADQVFSIQATAKESTAAPATVAVAVGSATHDGCAKDVKEANSEPITITIANQ